MRIPGFFLALGILTGPSYGYHNENVDLDCNKRIQMCFQPSVTCAELCNDFRLHMCYEDCLTDLQNTCPYIWESCVGFGHGSEEIEITSDDEE